MLRRILWRLTWLAWRPLLGAFCHFRVEGQEHCRNLSGPLMVMANHAHYLDPFTLSAAMPFGNHIFPIRFLTNHHYMNMPILDMVTRAYGAIPVELGSGMEKALRDPERILHRAGVVGFFPEGGFTEKEGEFRKAKPGIAYLGIKTGVSILPIAINGHGGLGLFHFLFRRVRISVAFGKPFTMKEIAHGLTVHASKEELAHAADLAMDRVRKLHNTIS